MKQRDYFNFVLFRCVFKSACRNSATQNHVVFAPFFKYDVSFVGT